MKSNNISKTASYIPKYVIIRQRKIILDEKLSKESSRAIFYGHAQLELPQFILGLDGNPNVNAHNLLLSLISKHARWGQGHVIMFFNSVNANGVSHFFLFFDPNVPYSIPIYAEFFSPVSCFLFAAARTLYLFVSLTTFAVRRCPCIFIHLFSYIQMMLGPDLANLDSITQISYPST